MRRLLVTGVGGSASHNFIKSLRMAPEKFYIVGTDVSKYYLKLSAADKNYLMPKHDSSNYVAALMDIVNKEKIDFVHAQPDPEVEKLSLYSQSIKAKTFIPKHHVIMAAKDKFMLNNTLRLNNVPVPKAWMVQMRQDLIKAFNEKTTVKLWLRAVSGAGSLAALPVTSSEQAQMWIDYWTPRGITWGDFMLSEFLPGKEYAFQSLWKDGKLITSAARQRIEYLFQNRMPSGQSSTPTIAKSVHNPEVNDVCYNAVKALTNEATGVFCVDLKENEKGIPCVTEINYRFFTTSLFFTNAGSNMPYYYVKLGLGEKLPRLPKFDAVPENLYWIRQVDFNPIMVKERDL